MPFLNWRKNIHDNSLYDNKNLFDTTIKDDLIIIDNELSKYSNDKKINELGERCIKAYISNNVSEFKEFIKREDLINIKNYFPSTYNALKNIYEKMLWSSSDYIPDSNDLFYFGKRKVKKVSKKKLKKRSKKRSKS